MSHINTPETSNTVSESQDLSRESHDAVLGSFRGLLNMPSVLSGLEEKISTMENGINKQLLEAAMRRVKNISERTEQIHAATHAKLERLMNRIDVSEDAIA